MLASVALFALCATASATIYSDAVLAALKLQTGNPSATIAGATQPQLEAATISVILKDPAHTAAYVHDVLVLRADAATIAPSFSQDLGNSQPVMLKSLIGQGAIQAEPAISGSITTALLASTGPAITNLGTFGVLLARNVVTNSAAVGDISKSLSVTYGTSSAEDAAKVALAYQMISASPLSATAITEEIGQTFGLVYSGTGQAYPDRERVAQFAYALAQRLPTTLCANAAKGLVLNNTELAPRIVNEMLSAKPTLAAAPFAAAVAAVVDPEEACEIVSALTFGPTPGYPYTTPIKPWLQINSANISQVPTVAASIAKAIAGRTSGLNEYAQIASQFAAGLLNLGGTPASYQATITNLTTAVVRVNPSMADQITGSVAQAWGHITGTGGNSYLDTLAAAVNKIAGVNTVQVTNAVAAVKLNPTGNAYVVGCINTDETPSTNL